MEKEPRRIFKEGKGYISRDGFFTAPNSLTDIEELGRVHLNQSQHIPNDLKIIKPNNRISLRDLQANESFD